MSNYQDDLDKWKRENGIGPVLHEQMCHCSECQERRENRENSAINRQTENTDG